ncbi:hypothetical protein BAC3_00718 [uncultured bacterium]|nr:hypothetical protein BAC3_00718 [uncultured bacterium]
MTPINSPCIRKCCLDRQDICMGCFRSLDEILAWTKVDDRTRQQFLQNAQHRKHRYQQEQGVNNL